MISREGSRCRQARVFGALRERPTRKRKLAGLLGR
jgi:hypothetical protein